MNATAQRILEALRRAQAVFHLTGQSTPTLIEEEQRPGAYRAVVVPLRVEE